MKKFEIEQGKVPVTQVTFKVFYKVTIDFNNRCWRMHLAHELGHILDFMQGNSLGGNEKRSKQAQMRADKLAKSFLKPKYWDISCIRENYRKEALNDRNNNSE